MTLLAITRAVSPAIAQCELTHLAREPIDFERARAQHQAYERCLAALGCRVHQLPAAPDLPDSVFIEDTAVVLDEVAVITRPGAESRRPETEAVAEALLHYRPLLFIESPGTIDGGDVLVVGKTVYVGVSSRTNPEAVVQLERLVAHHGYQVSSIAVHGCLHLKSAVTQAGASTVLVNPEWVSAAAFKGLRVIEVDPTEPFGANVVLIGDTVIHGAAFPRTRARLTAAGIPVMPVDASELAKAEGAVTCCSLLVRTS